ncbi:MAG: hypothetical protein FJ146_10990 [Deltaproteobacteria bacterium]|nr:hypothetical protein [Deltaproteobacteria bacterium]
MFTHGIRRKALGIAAILLLVACATPQRSTHAKRSRARSSQQSNNFSLYSNKSLDKKILNRGKKNLGSVAMETY